MHPYAVMQMLVLLALANGVPLAAKKLLGDRLGWPLDGNCTFVDGRPLFGPSKTLRGVVLAILAAAAAAPLLGLDWTIGARAGALAMLGDLASSFTKRRLGRPPSSRATGLDQIPEALFPLVGCRIPLGLGAVDIGLGVALFFLGEVLASRVLFRLRLRDRPY
jgi:hypothetical protein